MVMNWTVESWSSDSHNFSVVHPLPPPPPNPQFYLRPQLTFCQGTGLQDVLVTLCMSFHRLVHGTCDT